jgi:[ribosomal protein S5]-alanine N-acetyltransferase
MDRVNLPQSIETERLLLQRLRYEDAEEIFYSYASKQQATHYVSWPTHTSVKETRTYLRYANHAWNSGLDFSFSIRMKETHHLIGSYGVINEMGKIQFGYVVSPTFWGNGYAKEACAAITDLLKNQVAIYRIGTYVDCDNVASMKVLEKCGYTREAKLANWMRFPNQGNLPKDCWVYVYLQKKA